MGLLGPGAIARRARAFVADTRAGATAIAAAAVTVMTVGASALIVDHVWLVDQRDVLKTAADAASVAATHEIGKQLAANPRIDDADLKTALERVARRYVLANLGHLPAKRFKKARKTLEVEVRLDRSAGTVSVLAQADLGGTLFARNLPLLGNYEGPEATVVKAGVESESTPVEVVLAIDMSASMSDDLRGRWSPTQSRLAVVKGAAKDLVTILDPNGYNGVAVGIVPWHWTVRLDDTAAKRWEDQGWAVHAGSESPPPAWRGCFAGRRIYNGTSDVPKPTVDDLFEDLPADAAFAQETCTEGKLTGDLMPTLFPLNTTRADIEDHIDALGIDIIKDNDPSGTYSTLGVVWGQRMLEPTWKSVWGGTGVHPADPATPEHAKLRKAIVLLTDGRDYCGRGSQGRHCADSPNAVTRAQACAAAKSRGTEVFVVAAMHPDQITGGFGDALRACSSASDDEHPTGTRRPGTTYVFLNNATPANLEAAFKDIGGQLRTLRRVS